MTHFLVSCGKHSNPVGTHTHKKLTTIFCRKDIPRRISQGVSSSSSSFPHITPRVSLAMVISDHSHSCRLDKKFSWWVHLCIKKKKDPIEQKKRRNEIRHLFFLGEKESVPFTPTPLWCCIRTLHHWSHNTVLPRHIVVPVAGL
jgi:hypothetical protein